MRNPNPELPDGARWDRQLGGVRYSTGIDLFFHAPGITQHSPSRTAVVIWKWAGTARFGRRTFDELDQATAWQDDLVEHADRHGQTVTTAVYTVNGPLDECVAS